MEVREEMFKGRKVVVLEDEKGIMRLGLRKCKAVLNNIVGIRAFVEKNGS